MIISIIPIVTAFIIIVFDLNMTENIKRDIVIITIGAICSIIIASIISCNTSNITELGTEKTATCITKHEKIPKSINTIYDNKKHTKIKRYNKNYITKKKLKTGRKYKNKLYSSLLSASTKQTKYTKTKTTYYIPKHIKIIGNFN